MGVDEEYALQWQMSLIIYFLLNYLFFVSINNFC